MDISIRSTLRPGDLGKLVLLHGELYAAEYALDITFESYVAGSLADWVAAQTPRDRIWLAEQHGQLVGSVAIVASGDHEARLRWFVVHPAARGQGLGTRLLGDAVRFARDSGYRSLYLGTFSALTAASRLYRAMGFEKVNERCVTQWGARLVEEWYLLKFGEPLPPAQTQTGPQEYDSK